MTFPVVVFGAGSIGRGLLGQLLAQNGRSVVFVEAVPALRAALQEAGRYSVRLTGRKEEQFSVSDFSVIGPEDSEALVDALAVCPFVATAVGGVHLPKVAGFLVEALRKRDEPLPVLLCENWPNAAAEMSGYLVEGGVAPGAAHCVAASVERMVRPGDGLELVGESCETLLLDGNAWPEPHPALDGFLFVDSLEPYYKRKLYTNNAGHVVLAYEGALRGCRTLCEALAYPEVAARLRALLEQAAEALHRQYGLAHEALAEHVDSLLTYRYPNLALADTVVRVGRQPLRKLGPAERLTGLLRLLEKHGLDTDAVCATMAAAMRYFDPEDPECVELRGMTGAGGAEAVLTSVCGLRAEDAAFRSVVRHYNEIRM